MKYLLFLFLFFLCDNGFAQKDSATIIQDSSMMTIQGFYSNKNWKDVPAALVLVQKEQLQAVSTVSMLPAFNAVSGVRMEERSPGSYRLAIRGSSLRSPFGVRNVKVYIDEMPLTDGGGNTYLNIVGLNWIDAAEIMKGPSSSIYGAGTGGVLLLKTNLPFSPQHQNEYLLHTELGSYALFTEDAAMKIRHLKFALEFQQQHQQSNGYRDQSALRKDVFHLNSKWKWNQQSLHFQSMYTDLFYQTPGGLTLAQMNANPQAARPSSGALPGAVQQNASVRNKTFFNGIAHEWKPSTRFTFSNMVGFHHTDFINPAINNYEERKENNLFVRSRTNYSFNGWNWMSGIEYLQNFSYINDYGNRNGMKDTVQFKDHLKAGQWTVFMQLQKQWGSFFIQAALSANQQTFNYRRTTDTTQKNNLQSNSQIVLAPRMALNYQLTKNIVCYAMTAKGFSPPSLAEIHPSDGQFHSELQSEYGWNYELGLKGNVWNRKLSFDIAAYCFNLQNAIVRRNNTVGQEYFVNAGNIVEKGFETWALYRVVENKDQLIRHVDMAVSYTYQPYRFTSYKQGAIDYSGNAVTGVPVHVATVVINVETKKQVIFSFQLNNTAAIPMNDANDEYAKAYTLLQASIKKKIKLRKYVATIYINGDNLLNQPYSLGNDINAAGRRYYNPSATINFSTGISLGFNN